MTFRLCMGKSLTFFYSVTRVAATNMLGRNLLITRFFLRKRLQSLIYRRENLFELKLRYYLNRSKSFKGTVPRDFIFDVKCFS